MRSLSSLLSQAVSTPMLGPPYTSTQPHPSRETAHSEEGTTGHMLTHLTGKSMVGRKEIGHHSDHSLLSVLSGPQARLCNHEKVS